MAEPELELVAVMICNLCLDGVGGECHVPGCLFWMNDAPANSIRVAAIKLRVCQPETQLEDVAWKYIEERPDHRGQRPMRVSGDE
jgi:hypothetical protein